MARRPSRRLIQLGCNYPGRDWALGGCVADARAVAAALEPRGFEVRLFVDDGPGATSFDRASVLAELDDAIAALRRPGDHVVLGYSGHGTYLPDVDGDEPDGRDEALCVPGFEAGGYLTDDDIRTRVAALAPGVGFTVIADSCHSGTVSRLGGFGAPAPRAAIADGSRALHAPPSPRRARYLRSNVRYALDADRAHEEFRRAIRAAGEPPPPPRAVTAADLRSVAFSACRDVEVAYEDADPATGQTSGVYTRALVTVLTTGGRNGKPLGATVSRAGLLRRVTEAMGPGRSQTPTLDSAPGAEGRTLWSWTVPA